MVPQGHSPGTFWRTSVSLVQGDPQDSATLPSGPPSPASGLRRRQERARGHLVNPLHEPALWRLPRRHFGSGRLGPGVEEADVILSPTALHPTPNKRKPDTPHLLWRRAGEGQGGSPQALLQSPPALAGKGRNPSRPCPWPSPSSGTVGCVAGFHLPATNTS